MGGLTKEHKAKCGKCNHAMAAHKSGKCHMRNCKKCG